MNIRTTLIIVIVLTLAGLAFSLAVSPNLPERVPSHWDAAGQIDGYTNRTQALWFLPGLSFGIALLMLFLPKADPLRQNVDQFRPYYHWMVIGMVVFMNYLHALSLLVGLGVAFNMTTMILPAMAALFIGISFMLEKARPNWFIGIRTPWTLSSPTVWEKTHRLAAVSMRIGGVLALVGMLMPPEIGFTWMMVMVMGGSFIPVGYSYWAYQKERKP